MWLEYNIAGKFGLINSDRIFTIHLHDNNDDYVIVDVGQEFLALDLKLKSRSDAISVIQGFQLALNGHDFIYSDDEYIRPIVRDKQERLYHYMMYKELLADKSTA